MVMTVYRKSYSPSANRTNTQKSSVDIMVFLLKLSSVTKFITPVLKLQLVHGKYLIFIATALNVLIDLL